MNMNIFFVLGLMIPALANAGSLSSSKEVGACTEESPASKYGYELTGNFPAPPLHQMQLRSIKDSSGKKPHLEATLTSGGSSYLLTSYPGRSQLLGAKEVWTKNFKNKSSGEFAADDGSQIILKRHAKSPSELMDPGMSFDPAGVNTQTYDTSVMYTDISGKSELIKMTCRVQNEQYAELDGSLDRFEHFSKAWQEANDVVQNKDVPTNTYHVEALLKSVDKTTAE